jgi:hypothetical protein
VEMRIRTEWLIALGVVFMATPARARDSLAYLVVTRDESARDCPDAATLAERVNAILNSSVVRVTEPESSRIWIQLEMNRDLEGYRAAIQTRGERFGSRVIRDAGQSCSNLAEATAVALAIVLDQPPAAQAQPPAPPPPPNVPAQPAPAQDRTPEKPEDAPAFSPAVALEGGVALSVLEHPVPTLELSAQGRFGRAFSLALGVGACGRDQVDIGERRVELSLLQANLRACLNAYSGANGARLAWCAGPLFGMLGGKGENFDENLDQTSLLVAITAGLEARASLAFSFSWLARASLFVPVVRPGFSVEEDGELASVFEVPRAGGLFSLGFVYGN